MTRNLHTVAAFAAAGPFTQSQLRWWIFTADENGLAKAGAILRVGRRIYIDSDKFESWIDSQNEQATAAAA
jgi:hypothetical protein